MEGNYRATESLRREREVAERLEAGMGHKQIAADLGITHHAVHEIIARLEAAKASQGPAADSPDRS